jgi:hypothetical protein
MTTINQPIIERIVERTVSAPSTSGISEQTLAGRLASLKDDLLLRIAAVASAPIAFSGPAAILSQSAAANLPPSVIPTNATNSPESALSPVIELNGNASSTIELGDIYNDLGSRIVAPESDLNLGIVIVLDGATTTAVSIDATVPGEHTILYTVTSPTTGLTGSALRTVTVSPATQSSELPANDNPFNLAPVNDNASSTSFLIVEPTASI